MEDIEKKRLANEKRLKAIKEWQKSRNQITKVSSENLDAKVGTTQNKKIIYNSDDEETTKNSNQLKLFDSDEDNDDSEDLGDCFKIRPQFEGKNGQRMLHMSSELSDRFKLDERFREEDEESISDENLEDNEKDKNIRILESVLGHEVSKKHPSFSQNSKRKIEIERFDPDDEKNVSCIKDTENVSKKPKLKKKKTEPEVPIEEIPISKERYIEVTSNLKHIMSSATTFSFSEKFNVLVDSKEDKRKEDFGLNNENAKIVEDTSHNAAAGKQNSYKMPINNFEISSTFKDSFFISNSDERLKEGIEFFMRPKPMDQIREEWAKKRERVLEIFKKRRKSAIRGFTKQVKKQNQRKKVSTKK